MFDIYILTERSKPVDFRRREIHLCAGVCEVIGTGSENIQGVPDSKLRERVVED